MAGHSVAANLLMLVLLVGGFIFALNIRKEVFPDYDLDLINITVPYPGASPEEVERGILLSIEEAIVGFEGVKKVTSTAQEGIGQITVEVIEGEDIQAIFQDVQNEVDRITSFPEDAEEPQIVVAKRKRYAVSLALYGDQTESVLRELAEEVRDRLLQDPGITQVEMVGIRQPEISVAVSQNTLRRYDLTLEEVARRIREASVELPGGAVKTDSGDVLVRIRDRRDYGREFAKIPVISTTEGTKLILEDIAVITDGFEETDNVATFNGMPAVLIEVFQVGEQTPISVAKAVKQQVELINRQVLPTGVSLEIRDDRSDIYEQRMDLLLRNGYLGLGLVFFLLAIFLEARLAFWVSLGIPVSFLGSMLILPGLGVSINMVSMFAFIVTLGIVVDDSIVVGENIYYHHQRGNSWFEAALKGAGEISMPVSFSVLTNMVAFLPMLFVPGFIGKVFGSIPIVVIAVFTISLIESLLILPAHVGHQRAQYRGGAFGWLHERQQAFSRFFTRMVETRYGPFLAFCLRFRYITISIGVSFLIIAVSYIKSGRMGFELFPKVESDFSMVTAVLPFGTSFQKTLAVQEKLVDAGRQVVSENGGETLSEGIFAVISGNRAEVRIYLTPPGTRPISTAVLTDRWREAVGSIPGLESIKFESDAGGPGSGAAISVELSHRDVRVLEKASMELADAISFYPEALDIDDGFSPGKQQLDFQITPEGRSLGLTSQEVARQVRHAYYGAEALRQQRGRNEIKVMVRLPRSERISEFFLEEMILRAPSGSEIPLREAVTTTRGRAYTSIDRRDGRRIITVTADCQPRSKAGMILQSMRDEILPDLQRKYAGLTFSFEGRQADRRESFQSLIRGLLMALIVIYALLAVPFNSYIQPMIIMISIPFGIVGAVLGHLIMGYSLSIISMFGIVALSGVVVNDSLVLIDFANRKRGEGFRRVEAVMMAGIHRFRPILLTTLTTFGGLAPMIFETSRQARFLIPMAISLGFGILFATLITLAIVPCLYLIVEDFQKVTGMAKPEDPQVTQPNRRLDSGHQKPTA